MNNHYKKHRLAALNLYQPKKIKAANAVMDLKELKLPVVEKTKQNQGKQVLAGAHLHFPLLHGENITVVELGEDRGQEGMHVSTCMRSSR